MFAPTKASLIKVVTRWGDLGITCVWYDWYTEADPFLRPEPWFEAHEEYRSQQIDRGKWSKEDEINHQRLRPDNYRGWWTLKNLPHESSLTDFMGGCDGRDDLIDPALPGTEVEIQLQERIFNAWEDSCHLDIEVMSTNKFEEFIAYWKSEKAAGRDYYGNDNSTPA
ncbi:hypothetical protein [Pseudomonas aeruginosa]|uniref:hypothetical protein n=1 Tax=Pseudomonas aeruginosa TaxID=287 RepID=UPI0012987454|nr:hypothetical protein [Pseudomonas aeruginosa]